MHLAIERHRHHGGTALAEVEEVYHGRVLGHHWDRHIQTQWRQEKVVGGWQRSTPVGLPW